MTHCPPGSWQVAAPSASPVVLAARSPADPDAARLLAEFYAEQVGRYGWAESVDPDPAAYADPCGRFVIACAGESAVGCGGWRWHDHETGTTEIKKLYVVRAARRIGVGRALLAWLEVQAASASARRVILETGVRNTAAHGLLAAAGYLPVPVCSGPRSGDQPGVRAFLAQ